MIDRNKIIKGVLTLVGIFVLVILLRQTIEKNSTTLEDYAKANPEIAYMEKPSPSPSPVTPSSSPLPDSPPASPTSDTLPSKATEQPSQSVSGESTELIGASLNRDLVIDERFTYKEGFYYEPLSDNLCRYITGISFPPISETNENPSDLVISYDDLTYVHILHFDFDGNPSKGELICNKAIAQDLVEIFYELYINEYQLEKVRLIDEYDGDDTASMEDNNTSCFNYRLVEGSTSLSKHALGLALDINPMYNPYITYEKDGSENVSPVSALPYADRESSFPYKIDENDLCYKLFKEHGFTWGGNWNSSKDYQHFQKVIE